MSELVDFLHNVQPYVIVKYLKVVNLSLLC